MQSKSYHVFFASFFMIMGLFFVIFNIVRENNYYDKGYKKTFDSSFRGSILNTQFDKSTITLTLDNNEEFIFVQESDSFTKNEFMKIAQFGDSVSKKAFSNELIVYRKNKPFEVKIYIQRSDD